LLSRAGGTSELLGFSATLIDIEYNWLCNPIRDLCKSYASAELLWYMSGERDIKRIKEYAPSYQNFAEHDIAHGAYGWRMANPLACPKVNQIGYVLDILRKHPNSRQAVISLWWPTDLPHAFKLDVKDMPCTLTLQFIARHGKLHMIVNMRSNDIWLGFPYDVFCFTTLQKLMARSLDLEFGTYTHNVGSMHIYDKHFDKAKLALSCTDYKHRRLDLLGKDENTYTVSSAVAKEEILRCKREDYMLDHDYINAFPFFCDMLQACRHKLYDVKPVYRSEAWKRC